LFQGLGKKREPGRAYTYDPDFMSWMPVRREMESNRPLKSTYQMDFARNGNKQMLVRRPKTSFEGDPTTSYRYAHCNDGPNMEEIRWASRRAVELTTIQRLEGARMAKPPCRETVASCLSWYRPCVPGATPVTDYNHCNNTFVPKPPATAPATLQQHTESLPAPPPPPPPPAPVVVAAE
jgi:hypothetical protein